MVKNATWVLVCLTLLLFVTALLGPPLLHLPELWSVLVGPEGLRIWAEHSASLTAWSGAIARSFFPWPFVVLLIVALFVMSKFTPQIEVLARSLRRVEILGTKIEFSQETQPFVFEQFEKVNDFIVLYRRRVRDATQEQITRDGLYDNFTKDINSCLDRLFGRQRPAQYRATVHIEDFVFVNFLQQLFDYYPFGGGAGRAFSVRYGVIGKAWRSRQPYAAGRLLTGELAEKPAAEKRERISLEWGMTTTEARAASERPSYLCLPIVHERRVLGLLYIDSNFEDAFGENPDAEHLREVFQDQFDGSGFGTSVATLIERLGRSGPRVELDLGKV